MADSLRRKAEGLFQQAADLFPEERQAFLDEHCGADDVVRAEVESLLQFLDNGTVASLVEVDLRDETESSLVGTTIGPYRVSREIGRGGMGVFYLARPSRRSW